MKVKTLIKEMYHACIVNDTETQQELWNKALKKSLKHKRTYLIK
jgi:ribosomal protein S20